MNKEHNNYLLLNAINRIFLPIVCFTNAYDSSTIKHVNISLKFME
jgi:hypothetical protein